jgi:hypothetical protein
VSVGDPIAWVGSLGPEVLVLYGIKPEGAVLVFVRPDGRVAYRAKCLAPDPTAEVASALMEILHRAD